MTEDPMNPPADIEAFRRMDPVQKLSLIGTMHVQAREWKRAALRSNHPDWSPQRLERTLRELFLHGTV
jgi:hypothetical protein